VQEELAEGGRPWKVTEDMVSGALGVGQ